MPLNNAGFLPVTIYFRDSILPDLAVNSGEAGARGYHAVFVQSHGQTITPAADIEATIWGYNKDTKKAYMLNGQISEDGWDFRVPPEAISQRGETLLQLKLKGASETVIKTHLRTVHIGPSIDTGDVTGTSVVIDFERAQEAAAEAEDAAERANATNLSVKEAERLRKEAEEARAAAEDLRAQAEAERKEAEIGRSSAEKERAAAETKRKEAETAREAAETERAKAETQRKEDETLRKSTEEERISAESGRKEAETARAAAELERAQAETKRISQEAERQANTSQIIKEAQEAKDYILSDDFENLVNPLYVGPEKPKDEAHKPIWLDSDEKQGGIMCVGPYEPTDPHTFFWVDTSI